jgi:hypothetical protein
VIWVLKDKDAFAVMLGELSRLNTHLRELIGNHRLQSIDENVDKMYREMVQHRNKLQDLHGLLDAVSGIIATKSLQERYDGASSSEDRFRDLIRLKSINQRTDQILSGDGKDLKVPEYHKNEMRLIWKRNSGGRSEESRPRALLAPGNDAGRIEVWVEWKEYQLSGGVIPAETRARTLALAELLHSDKPANLCTPHCIGFFDDRDFSGETRYGWILEVPIQNPKSAAIASLFELFSSHPAPTLTERVALAQKLTTTILYLHTANWLHKAVRSDNVIFHRTKEGKVDFNQPVLSGFDYARPSGGATTMREKTGTEEDWDLYRWPDIQYSTPIKTNSRKTFDVYSLGLVLLEIAHWQRLPDLMGLAWPGVDPVQAKSIRERLLGIADRPLEPASDDPGIHTPANALWRVALVAGQKYFAATKRCIIAHGEEGLGIDDKVDQNEPEPGLKLQEAYYGKVVQVLNEIVL